MIVIWAIAILVSIGVIASTYEIRYKAKPKPNTLEALLINDEPIGLTIHRLNRLDIATINLIRFVFPILLVGGLLLYSLRNKTKQ